jgi:hypothetical protein
LTLKGIISAQNQLIDAIINENDYLIKFWTENIEKRKVQLEIIEKSLVKESVFA